MFNMSIDNTNFYQYCFIIGNFESNEIARR